MTNDITVPQQNRINEARLALSQARTVPDMKRIRTFAEAMVILSFHEGYTELRNNASILMLEAERALGRWLKDNVNHNGGRPGADEDYHGLPEGISKKQSHYYQLEAALPESKFRSWLDSCLGDDNKEISAGILRKIAKAHRNGINDVDEEIPSFERMKSSALYWVKLVLKHYYYRYPELVREIINERKAVRGEWK